MTLALLLLGLPADEPAPGPPLEHGAVRRFSKAQWLRWLGWLTAAYGVYALWKRGLPEYLFLRTHFAFFDYEEPVLFFFADYLAIMGGFIFCGYYGSRLLNRSKKQKQREK